MKVDLNEIKEVLKKVESVEWNATFDDFIGMPAMTIIGEECTTVASKAPEWLSSLVEQVEQLERSKEMVLKSHYMLERQVEEYSKHATDFEEMYKAEHREKNQLKRQVEEMQKTLEWYASDRNWGSIEELGAMVSDGGELARQTLQSLKGEPHERTNA